MKKDIKRRRHGGNAAYSVSNYTKYAARRAEKRMAMSSGWNIYSVCLVTASIETATSSILVDAQ